MTLWQWHMANNNITKFITVTGIFSRTYAKVAAEVLCMSYFFPTYLFFLYSFDNDIVPRFIIWPHGLIVFQFLSYESQENVTVAFVLCFLG